MAKRINISIPDELFDKIQIARQGFSKKYSLSRICQAAIEGFIEDALIRDKICRKGYAYGQGYIHSLSLGECIKAKKMIDRFPRKYPEDLTKVLLESGLVTPLIMQEPENLQKHIEILDHWKNGFEVFQYDDEIMEWMGDYFKRDGLEFEAPHDAIHNRQIEAHVLWRKGVIKGIKDATKSIKEEK
jgi:hypothetical protein